MLVLLLYQVLAEAQEYFGTAYDHMPSSMEGMCLQQRAHCSALFCDCNMLPAGM